MAHVEGYRAQIRIINKICLLEAKGLSVTTAKIRLKSFLQAKKSSPNFLNLLATTSVLFVGLNAIAAGPNFNNLSQADFDKVSKEFSANSNLNDAMPPSSLGSIFGFEFGVLGGVTSSPNTAEVANRSAPGSNVNRLPHGTLLGAVGIPFGLTAEASFLPKTSINGVHDQQFAGALKWTFSDVLFPNLPVNMAIRGFIGLVRRLVEIDRLSGGIVC